MPGANGFPGTSGLWSAIAVLVGSTIGSGIFRVPASVAERLQEPGPVLLAWVAGRGHRPLRRAHPGRAGGGAPAVGRGLRLSSWRGSGPLPAFLFGWSELTVIRASALGAIATIFAEYLGYFIPLTPMQVRCVAAVAVIAVGLLNYLGVNSAAVVMNLATVAKYGPWPRSALLAFTAGQGSTAHFTPAWSGGIDLSLIATALIAIMWTYDGWADLSFMGGEVKNPGAHPAAGADHRHLRHPARSISCSTSPTSTWCRWTEMARSPLIAATAAERIPLFGRYAGGAVDLGGGDGLLLRHADGSMMTGPRIFFAMADRGLFFRAIARVSPEFQSPSVAIWLATALGVVYVLLNDFQQLADKFILGIWPFYALAVAAVFVLRRTRPDLPRPYRTWGYPVVPLLFLLASVAMVVNALWTDPVNTGITFAIILAGVPVYYGWRGLSAWSRRLGSECARRRREGPDRCHPERSPKDHHRCMACFARAHASHSSTVRGAISSDIRRPHAVRQRPDGDEIRPRLGIRPHVRPA